MKSVSKRMGDCGLNRECSELLYVHPTIGISLAVGKAVYCYSRAYL